MSGLIVHVLIQRTRSVVILTEGAEGTAREEHHALQLLVEEEVVEVPDGSVLPEGVQGHVGVVGVDVAVEEDNLLVQSHPELVMNLAVLRRSRDAQKVVDVVSHKLKINNMR